MQEIHYIERHSGKVAVEKVPGAGSLRFLYGHPLGRLGLWSLVKRKWFSQMGGSYMNSKRSRKNIAPFVAAHGINLQEFEVPKEGFKHFNDFFYRKIRPEARPIGKGIVSPADGKILAFEDIDLSQKFFVKGQDFDLETFLQNRDLATKYRGGSMAIIRLAPADYHRFHFPASGLVGKVHKIKGAYFSVSPLALRKSLRIFLQNKREYCLLESPEAGTLLICDIGATLTGSIIQTFKANSPVQKGQEKGYFAFGGSTTVLLFEPNTMQFAKDLLGNTQNGYETTIKMGESIGEFM